MMALKSITFCLLISRDCFRKINQTNLVYANRVEYISIILRDKWIGESIIYSVVWFFY